MRANAISVDRKVALYFACAYARKTVAQAYFMRVWRCNFGTQCPGDEVLARVASQQKQGEP